MSIVPRVDRVWLSTEAIGAGAFLAHLGTRSLIEECARRHVPASVLATSDKLVPGGALRLPAWAGREGWRLWEDAPEGVRLETQFYEAVPTALLDLVGGFHTEIGAESAAAMHVRALRVEAFPPANGSPAIVHPETTESPRAAARK
jgi:translation initiation factor 2B subunit (eIF-2B alpha/beta/delta family)